MLKKGVASQIKSWWISVEQRSLIYSLEFSHLLHTDTVFLQDKLAGIDLQDLEDANAKTIQRQLLRLHSFGQRLPNSGVLRRLVSEFHRKISTAWK